MISLNLQLQNSVMKAQSKAVELELKKLELSQSNDHLKLLMVNCHYILIFFFKYFFNE